MGTSTATNKSIAPVATLTGEVGLGATAVTGQDTDTPTNAVKVLDAGSEGARLFRVNTKVRNTVVACRVLLFRGSDSSGTTKRLLKSAAVAAYTWSTTSEPVGTNEPDFGYTDSAPLILGPGESLWAAMTVAQTGSPILVNAEGGKYMVP